jgi:hypothetical protein
MKILEKENARRYIRKEGIKSYLLSSALTSNSELLTTNLVEIDIDGFSEFTIIFLNKFILFLKGLVR